MVTSVSAAAPGLLKPEEAAAELRIGRTRVYGLISTGELGSVKIGRSRRIPRAALAEYIDRLRAEAGA